MRASREFGNLDPEARDITTLTGRDYARPGGGLDFGLPTSLCCFGFGPAYYL